MSEKFPEEWLMGACPAKSLTNLDVKVSYDDFTIQRPTPGDRTSPALKGVTLYALAEDEAKRHSGAYGIGVDESSVTIAVAYIDPSRTLGSNGFSRFWQHAMAVQNDFYGLQKANDCKFGAKCNSNGARPCLFYHGRPGETRWLSKGARVLPLGLNKADEGRGVTFGEEAPSWAAVMTIRFPRRGDKVSWDSPLDAPQFSLEPITLTSVWRDRQVAKLADKTSFGDLDEPSSARDLFILKTYCEAVSGMNDSSLLDEAQGIVVAGTPQFRDKKWDFDSTRDFLSLRRFLIDTLTDQFNEGAAAFLATRGIDAKLIGRSWTLPRDLAPHVGAAHSISQLCPLGVPIRSLTHSLSSKFVMAAPNDWQSTAAEILYAKFNTPFREFPSLFNMTVLTETLRGQSAPPTLSSTQWDSAARRLEELSRREAVKLAFMEQYTNKVLCVAISVDANTVVLLSTGGYRISSPRNLRLQSGKRIQQVQVPPQ